MHEHFNKVYVHLKGLEIEMCILCMLRNQCDSLKILRTGFSSQDDTSKTTAWNIFF